jgi:hypothetical protein
MLGKFLKTLLQPATPLLYLPHHSANWRLSTHMVLRTRRLAVSLHDLSPQDRQKTSPLASLLDRQAAYILRSVRIPPHRYAPTWKFLRCHLLLKIWTMSHSCHPATLRLSVQNPRYHHLHLLHCCRLASLLLMRPVNQCTRSFSTSEFIQYIKILTLLRGHAIA